MEIRQFYSGKNVLISGGTGFMGKVLIEKLLRSCNKIGKIYVLCRDKRGLTSAQRIAGFAKIPLFQILLKQNPKALEKVVAVDSDITEPELGLKKEMKQELIDKVDIVFHLAASLKLEAGLKEATKFNVKGTLSMLKLAKEMKHLKVFIHSSTAFCHCEEEVLEERLYEPIYCPYDIMSAVDWMDDHIIDTITPKLLDKHPNCYTFTKRLAEGLMEEYGKQIPIAVVRPSIVVPSIKEPLPGWVDSLNGPIGVMAAGGKGVLRSMLCKSEYRAEVIPVDAAINSIIMVAWKRGLMETSKVPVFNISSGETIPITWGEVVNMGRDVIKEYPYDAGLWYPGGVIRTNVFIHTIIVFFCQLLPAYFIDFIMWLTRNKRFMVRIQNRISLGMKLLQYFTMRQWNFNTSQSIETYKSLISKEEQDIFHLPISGIDQYQYIKDAVIGSRVYCLKEPLETLPRARRHLKWLYLLDKITQFCFLLLFGWLLSKYLPIVQYMLNAILPDLAANNIVHKVTKVN